MKKKILVAVGECVYSQDAVRYVARMSSAAKNIMYTLFNVQPLVPNSFVEAAREDPEIRAEVDALIEKNKTAARCAVERFRDLMAAEGIPADRIEITTRSLQKGIAKDILSEAEQGDHNAIVLARRGLTPNRDFFIGTIAGKVIEHALKIPVWVAAGKSTPMNMLLSVDGSQNSFRVVDHVIQLVGPHPDLRVTLFHVPIHSRHYYPVNFEREHPRLEQVLQRKDEERMEIFYEKACGSLKAAGLGQGQIETRVSAERYDVSTGILREAKTGRYGTVVVGRRGESEAFFTGRIAARLVQKITDQALWVVP
ncbi:MAG: universal stress protein [Deltaproteobacteria bacterium]|nr:universal stress protein [Deltaproteobacteria bacterium]